MDRPYHHRHLRRALLDAALAAVRESGPGELSLRDLARRAGVSHAAPAHHFGDKAGLLTALATEGWAHLAAALRDAQSRGFLEVGVAYVRFAIQERAYFEVMFRPELYHAQDESLAAARAEAGNVLYDQALTVAEPRTGAPTRVARSDAAVDVFKQPGASREALSVAVAAWGLVHGVATLFLNGNLPPALGDDPLEITRRVAAQLFRS